MLVAFSKERFGLKGWIYDTTSITKTPVFAKCTIWDSFKMCLQNWEAELCSQKLGKGRLLVECGLNEQTPKDKKRNRPFLRSQPVLCKNYGRLQGQNWLKESCQSWWWLWFPFLKWRHYLYPGLMWTRGHMHPIDLKHKPIFPKNKKWVFMHWVRFWISLACNPG